MIKLSIDPALALDRAQRRGLLLTIEEFEQLHIAQAALSDIDTELDSGTASPEDLARMIARVLGGPTGHPRP